jgi:hypothetical protein
MATFVQRADHDAGSATGTVTFSSNVTQGNLLVLVVDAPGTSTTISSVPTDTRGNTWVARASGTASGQNTQVWLYDCLSNASTGANTVTVVGNNANLECTVWEFSASGATWHFDLATITSGSNTAVSSGNISTTNAVDAMVGFAALFGGVSSYGSGWTGTTTGDGNGSGYEITTASGSYAFSLTQTPSAGYIAVISAYYATASSLRPGPITGAIGVSGVANPRFTPIRPKASGAPSITGTVNPELYLTSVVASGTIAVTGVAVPHLLLRPGASGTLSPTGLVHPEVMQVFLDPGPLRGSIGVTGVVHGFIGPPNEINVFGTTLNVRLVVRPMPRGSIGVTNTTLNPELVGTLRPMAAGNINVTGRVNPRLTPFRPLPPNGVFNVTGTVNPRLLGGPPLEVTLPRATIATSGVINGPHFLLRPGASGTLRTSGGTTNPRIVLRPGPITGSVSPTGLINPEQYLYPKASGSFSPIGRVNVHNVGTLRPQAFGTITFSGLVNVEQQPLRNLWQGSLGVLGTLNPRLINTLNPNPPVIVPTSGYYVVEDVGRAFLVMYLQANFNYSYAVYHVEFGPFTDYPTALAKLMLFASSFFPNP